MLIFLCDRKKNTIQNYIHQDSNSILINTYFYNYMYIYIYNYMHRPEESIPKSHLVFWNCGIMCYFFLIHIFLQILYSEHIVLL